MLKRILRKLYLGAGLDDTRVGRLIYWLYKGSWRELPVERPDTDGVLVAFLVTGGIGDHLIAARYVRDLIAAVGEFRFDVYSSRPAIVSWIFGSMPQLNRAYDEYFLWHHSHFYRFYPLAIHVSSFVCLTYETAKWVALQRNRKLVRVCESMDRFRHAHGLDVIIDNHPRLDGLLASKAVFLDYNRHSFAQAMSGIAYGGHLLPIETDADAWSKFGLQGRSYVTIHNGFDAEFQTAYGFADKSTKVYPHFAQVLSALRARHRGLLVVQLGTSTSCPIEGVDVQLIGKTSLTETAGILAGATLHIDNESGLVHLAACLGKVSCVLFGPTPAAYFGYENNINITPTVCGGCWWTTANWMTHCPRRFEQPICLANTPPEVVANVISTFLDQQSKQAGVERSP